MQIKIVLNTKYGGAALSGKAARALGLDREVRRLDGAAGVELYDKHGWFLSADMERTDPALIRIVEEMGPEASGPHAHLVAKTIDIDLDITENDGIETARVYGRV